MCWKALKRWLVKSAVVELTGLASGGPGCSVRTVHAGGGQGCGSGHLEPFSVWNEAAPRRLRPTGFASPFRACYPDARMTIRIAIKRLAQAVSLAVVLPSAALAGFGRVQSLFTLFAQSYAMVPGVFGNFLRAAFYHLTLRDAAIDINIGFGTILVNPGLTIGTHTTIGSFCIVARAHIGHHSLIGSHVQIPSGRRQHGRDALGNLHSAASQEIRVGDHCWIGTSAVVLASIGDGSTVGAGAVVVKEIPPNSVAVGNPAHIVQRRG
jgi:virginiamycin A acetyltransferase